VDIAFHWLVIPSWLSLAPRGRGAQPPSRRLLVAPRARAQSHRRFVLLLADFIPDPLTIIFGASISEPTMRPNPTVRAGAGQLRGAAGAAGERGELGELADGGRPGPGACSHTAQPVWLTARSRLRCCRTGRTRLPA
jgi:hypothetical protein